MSDEETTDGDDAQKGDPDITSGTGATGGLPAEGKEGDEDRGTGEGDAGPASSGEGG